MRHAFPIALFTALICIMATAARAQTPLDTAFTYQGELRSSGAPATGSYDIRFRLYDAASGGTQISTTLCSDNLSIANGRFSVSLDFGAAFTGQKRFLEIEVRQHTGQDCSDTSGYTVLSPRQELTATPHAAYALTAGSAATAQTANNAASLNGQSPSFYRNAANLTGTLADARLSSNVARLDGNQTFTGQTSFSNPANTFSGIFSGNGEGLLSLNGAHIAAGTITRSRVGADVESVLSQWTNVPQPAAPLDAIAWGFNFSGQTNVPALPSGVTYTAVAGGGGHSLALRSDGTVVAWGRNGFGQTNVPALPSGVAYTAVAGGWNHSLALRSDGTVVAWGNNDFGQTNVPALPSGVTYTAVAGGFYHSLALRSDGTVVAWGGNDAGQTNVPALPSGVAYTAVAGGGYHSLALRSDGTAVAWGDNSGGQTNVPALPSGVTYTAVAGGLYHSLALRSDGTVVAWGNNEFGQTNVPALPSGVTCTAVASGWYHSLALRSDGTAVAWGYNNDGQTNVPALPSGMTYTAVAGGGYHSLALRSVTASLSSPLAVAASSFVGSGAALTNLSAANLTGTLAADRIPSLDASKITTGTLNNARTSGTNLNTPSTLVLRDGLGNFSAGTITANLNGNAATATTATNATNAAQLNGQPASFYTNAANLTGTLAVARIPDLDAAKITTGTLGDARLSSNIPRLNASNNFTGSQQTFSGTSGINISRGIIQKGGSPLTGTDDMGLYSQTNGTWMRFVTTNAPFQWFSDGGIGGPSPRMTLNPNGNLAVTGSLSKGGGSFKIDHPLDPENKYLYHSFVESPDMMNVYNGNVTTNGRGFATVTLPDYFEALNREFRYQLTVVDGGEGFALAKVSREIEGNVFEIRTSEPGVKVSWQVTGIRKDAWAEQNRIPNSVDKSPVEKGRYLHPEAFGKPASQGVLAVPTLPDTQASKRE